MDSKFSNLFSQIKKETDSVGKQNLISPGFIDNRKKVISSFKSEDMKTNVDDYRKLNIVSFKKSFSKLQKNYMSDNQNSKK